MANHPEALFNDDVMMIMSYIWGTKKPKPRPDLSPLGPARFQFSDERSRPLTNSNHKVAYFSTPMPSELSLAFARKLDIFTCENITIAVAS